MNSDRKISILICSRNRRESLENLVYSLHSMKTNYSYEIVIIEETDTPVPIEGTKYGPHPITNRGIPYARNLALQHANGDLVVFLDDDCFITGQWLDSLLEPFSDSSVAGVQGGVSVPNDTNGIGWAESILGFPGGGLKRLAQANGKNQETREISTLNCAYRRAVLEKIGGFDESLKLGSEDYLLAKQACDHGRCLFVPGAMVRHASRGSLLKVWRWFLRRGRAEIDLIRTGKQSDTTFWKLYRGSIFVKALFLLGIGIAFPEWIMSMILLSVLIYGFGQCIRYYKTWKYSKTGLGVLALVPIVKMAMDIATDWGRLRGIILE
jgi:GT2 family glycosyltransferase